MTNISLKKLLLTTAIAFGVANFAQAQEAQQVPNDTKPKTEFNHKVKHSEHAKKHKDIAHVGLFSPKLIKELQLTEEQKAKFDDIKNAKKSLRDLHKEDAKQLNEQRKELLKAKIVDLKALLDNGDKFHALSEKGKGEIRSKVIAFWDSLDDSQKERATNSFRKHQERMEQRFQEGHKHKEHRNK